jgi:hypothetical protein
MERVDRARRRSILALAAAPVLLLCLGTRSKAADAAPCVDLDSMPANQKSMRRSLGFKLQAPDANKRCGTCAFYTATAGDCGKCALLSGGVVAAENVCDSWAAKG